MSNEDREHAPLEELQQDALRDDGQPAALQESEKINMIQSQEVVAGGKEKLTGAGRGQILYPANQYQYYGSPGYAYMYTPVPFNNGAPPVRSGSSEEGVPKGQPSGYQNMMNVAAPVGYFTPRTSPNNIRPPFKTPASSPLQNSVQAPYPNVAASPNSPIHAGMGSGGTAYYSRLNTHHRRFSGVSGNVNSVFPVTPHNIQSQHAQHGSFFMTPSQMHGHPAAGRRSAETLAVNHSIRRQPRETSTSGASSVDWEIEGISMTNLYIKGLKNSCTDDDLYNMCQEFGKIHSSKAILDLTTHECKGFGFVMYETVEEAQVALKELTKLGYNVSFAKETFNTRLKNLQDEESTNVYVSNLPLEMDEEGMMSLFSPHTVLSTKILRDPTTQISRGVGFARMDSRASANAVITEFNGMVLDSGQCLQVRFADSPAQKRFKNLASPSRNGGIVSNATVSTPSSLGMAATLGNSSVSIPTVYSNGRSWQLNSASGISEPTGFMDAQNENLRIGPQDLGNPGIVNEAEQTSEQAMAAAYIPYFDGYGNSVIIPPSGYPYGMPGTYTTAGPSSAQVIYGAHYYAPPSAAAAVAAIAPRPPGPFQQPTLVPAAPPHHAYTFQQPPASGSENKAPNNGNAVNESTVEGLSKDLKGLAM